MPKDPRIKKVLVIGSGPIIIGQAAEFDYSGTQACRALKAEGIETVLLNSNPATIMTDPDVADHVYIEPMTLEVVERILDIEKPDSVLPNLGGQMGLNLSMELARSGYLDRTGIRLLACKPETIDRAEDRELFKETMEKLHQPIIPSEVVETLEDALACADRIGYPVIVRPAFTMGGTGGGICENKAKLIEIGTNGLRLSPIHQILVEKCIAGWKEIEYEVMRDHKGNVITVCNMENLDPVGIHTGDSVVVAPSQTLTDHEYQMLRTAALGIITELGIEGGCNCQFALKPDSYDYAVIEVNPRVSRSSALASKATGYPIAKITTKIALGYTLDDDQLQIVFEAVKALADRKKTLLDDDLMALVQEEVYRMPDLYRLRHVSVQSSDAGGVPPTAAVLMDVDGMEKSGAGFGVGPVDAIFNVINDMLGREPQLEQYAVNAVTGGTDALGEVTVRLREGEFSAVGRGAHPDILVATARAYVNALNHLAKKEKEGERLHCQHS